MACSSDMVLTACKLLDSATFCCWRLELQSLPLIVRVSRCGQVWSVLVPTIFLPKGDAWSPHCGRASFYRVLPAQGTNHPSTDLLEPRSHVVEPAC